LKATIVVTVIGVVGFGEDGKIAEKMLFPKDASRIAGKLADVESGRVIGEIAALIGKLKDEGYTTFVFESPELAQTARQELKVDVEVETPSDMGQTLRGNLGRFAYETGFLDEPSEIAQWVHGVSMELSRIKVRKATEKRDLLVVQAVQALDDMDKTLNLFMGRVREWYGLHFPELDRLLDKHETYARLVENLGKRENFTEQNLEKADLTKNKALQLAKAASRSMGADLYETDMEQVKALCRQVLQMYEARSKLEKYVDDVMSEVAPNTRALAGATLGARLIALAGGLQGLAKMPASTVQVLGAEKALFRSLTTGARPPKHGLIFQHALVHGAPRHVRGKVARALAGKLSIAVRTDAFSGNYVGDKLKEDLQKRVDEINKKYAEPRRKAEPTERRREKPRRAPIESR